MSTDMSTRARRGEPTDPAVAQAYQRQALGLTFGIALVRQGYSGEQAAGMMRRIPAEQKAIEARYPVTDKTLPDAERQARDTATLNRALQERSTRLFLTS